MIPSERKLYYESALNIYRELENTETLRFDVLNNLIIMSINFKKYEKAKSYFNQAKALYDTNPNLISDVELSFIYQNTGIAHLELKEYEAAMEKGQQSLALLDASEEPVFYSNGLELMAMIKSGEQAYDTALEYLEEILKIRRQNKVSLADYQRLATSYENICDIHILNQQLDTAKIYLKDAFESLLLVAAFDEEENPIIEKSLAIDDLSFIRLIELKARIYQAQFERNKDITHLKQALDLQFKIDTIINHNLIALQLEDSKLEFFDLMLEHYNTAIQCALLLFEHSEALEYLHAAYYFSSKTKAIILQYELNNSKAFQSIASEALIQKEKQLRKQVLDLQAQLSDNSDENQLQTYIKAQRALDAFIEKVEEDNPDYFQKKYAFIRPPEVQSLQDALPEDQAIVEYFYSKDNIYSFWISADDFTYQVSPNNQKVSTTLNTFVDWCHDPKQIIQESQGQFLYELLLKRGIDQLNTSINRLCIIPDGPLHSLSFEALPGMEHNNFIVQDYAITYSYSSGLLLRESPKIHTRTYVGFGTEYSPVLNEKLKWKRRFEEENLGQLSLSQEEILRGSLIFDGSQYVDQRATLENFYRYSGQANIIHLSLHGLVDLNDPGRSCVLFDDHQDNFILSARDLYAHKINADLVILSACHTASGKIYYGEGVQGMSKAFLLSGAHNILSSLWSASEASALMTMTNFLEYLHEGSPKDLALNQSKVDYLKNVEPHLRHPYYWANFILLGELPTKSGFSSNTIGLFLLFGLVILGLILYFRKKVSPKWSRF